MGSKWEQELPRPARNSATTATSGARLRKAPVYNPYDKFTQPEFDAWIGDITGTLRRALGHIEDTLDAAPPSATDSKAHVESDYDDDNDSAILELQARRAVEKGKARDPREGPGLGVRGTGSFEEPIDLGSDSEEEEEEVARMSLAPPVDEEDEEDEDEDEEEYDEEEEEGEEFLSDIPEEDELYADDNQPGPSSQQIRHQVIDDDDDDDGEEHASWNGMNVDEPLHGQAEDDQAEVGSYDEEGSYDEDVDDDEADEVVEVELPQFPARKQYSSRDMYDEDDYEDDIGSSPPPRDNSHTPLPSSLHTFAHHADEAISYADDDEDDEFDSDVSLASSPVQNAPEVIELDLDSDEASEEEEKEDVEPLASNQTAELEIEIDLFSEDDAPAAQDASFELDDAEQDVEEAVSTPLDHPHSQAEEDELDAPEQDTQVFQPDSQLTEQSPAHSIQFVEDESMDQVQTEESVEKAPLDEGSVEEDEIEDGESDIPVQYTLLGWHSQVVQEPVPETPKAVQQEEQISSHLDEEPPEAEPTLDDFSYRAASLHPDDASVMKPDVLADQADEPAAALPAALPMASTEPIIEEEIQESSKDELNDISLAKPSVVPPKSMVVETQPPLDALHGGYPAASPVAQPEDMLVDEDFSPDKTEPLVASPEHTIAEEVVPQDEDISPVAQEVVSPLVVPSSTVDRAPSPVVDEEPTPPYHYSIDSLPLSLIEMILQFLPDLESLQSSALVCQRFQMVLSRHPEWFAAFLDEEENQEMQTSEEGSGPVDMKMEVVEESPVLSDDSPVLEHRQMSPMLDSTDTAVSESQMVDDTAQPDSSLRDTPPEDREMSPVHESTDTTASESRMVEETARPLDDTPLSEDREMSILEHTDTAATESQMAEETAQPDLSLDDIPLSEIDVHTAPAPAVEELPPSHPDDVPEDAMEIDPIIDASQALEESISTPVEGSTLQDIAPAVESVPVPESTAEVLDAPTDDVWIAPVEPVAPASAPPLDVLEEESRAQDVDEEAAIQELEQTAESADVPAAEVHEEEDAAGEPEDGDEAVVEETHVVVEEEQVAAGPVEEHSQVQEMEQVDEGIEMMDEKIEEGRASEVETIGIEQVEEVEEVKAEVEVEMETREKTPAIPEIEPIVEEVEEVQPPEIPKMESSSRDQASGLAKVEPIAEVEEVQSSELETTSMEQTSTVPQVEPIVEEVEEVTSTVPQVEPIVEENKEVSSMPEIGKSTSEASPLPEPAADFSAPETSVQTAEIAAPPTTQANHSSGNRTQDLLDSDFLHYGALPQDSREQETPIAPVLNPVLEKPIEAAPRPENWDNTFLPTPPQENHEQFHAELLDYANQDIQNHVQPSMNHADYANQELQPHSMTHTDVFDYGQGFSNYDNNHLNLHMPGVHGSDHLYPTPWGGMHIAGSPKLQNDGTESYPYHWRPEREVVGTTFQHPPHNNGQPSYGQMGPSLERGTDSQMPEASGSGSSSSTTHSQSPLFTPPDLGMWVPGPFAVHYQSPSRAGLHPLAFSRGGKPPVFQFQHPLNYPPMGSLTPPKERAPVSSSHDQVLINQPSAFQFPPPTASGSSRDDEERAPPASITPGLNSQGKSCPSCTFLNADTVAKCTVCGSRLGRGSSRGTSMIALGAGAFPKSISQPRKTSRNGSLKTASVVSSRSNSVVDASPAKTSSNGRLTPQLSVDTSLPVAGPSQSGNGAVTSPLSSLNESLDQEDDFKKPSTSKAGRKSALVNEAGPSTGKRKRATRAARKSSAASISAKDKGKQKETSTPNVASKKKKSLTNHRRLTSRASSIMSTATDNSDTTTVPASTPTRPPQRTSSKPSTFWPSSLLHGNTHSQPRRHQHHLPTGPVAGAAGGSTNVYYSSPVTRSNCRYRRISLPIVEEGPRIQFLVPGCTLGDAELMEDEEIVDHGDATVEESTRVVSDIENLDFNAYLIGVIRQLVGLDLLREQEVYYLPKIGEDPMQYKKKRRASESSSPRKEASVSNVVPPGSPLKRKAVHDDFDEDEESSEESESDEDEEYREEGEPPAKRVKPESTATVAEPADPIPPPESSSQPPLPLSQAETTSTQDAPSSQAGPPEQPSQPPPSSQATQASTTTSKKVYKRKRLGRDMLEYKPNMEEQEESDGLSDEQIPLRKKKAQKRARPSAGGDEPEDGGRKLKKMKARVSEVVAPPPGPSQ